MVLLAKPAASSEVTTTLPELPKGMDYKQALAILQQHGWKASTIECGQGIDAICSFGAENKSINESLAIIANEDTHCPSGYCLTGNTY